MEELFTLTPNETITWDGETLWLCVGVKYRLQPYRKWRGVCLWIKNDVCIHVLARWYNRITVIRFHMLSCMVLWAKSRQPHVMNDAWNRFPLNLPTVIPEGRTSTRRSRGRRGPAECALPSGSPRGGASASAVPTCACCPIPWPGSTTCRTPRAGPARWAAGSATEPVGPKSRSTSTPPPTPP